MAAEDHDSRWKEIVDSPMAGIYLFELLWLAEDVIRRIDRVFEEAPPPKVPRDSYIKAGSVSADIYALLSDAAKIRTLITPRAKRTQQSDDLYELMVRRAHWLSRDILGGLDLPTIRSAEVRNSIEHFDERLDESAMGLQDGTIERPAIMPLDMAIGNRGTILSFAKDYVTVHPMRVYVADERTFMNGAVKIDLQALRDECELVRDTVGHLLPEQDEKRGGSFTIFP
jgi:hypothetical protein